jgi:glucose-1-phosphate cytidylyltransferase
MKVVLFCGGQGMRLRDYSEQIPKPMVNVGNRPIMWHLMKYYAHYGHKDFVLCLGHQAEYIKKYFLEFNDYLAGDFMISEGGCERELMSRSMADWRIIFAETGLRTNIGGRLLGVRRYVEHEDVFLANYTDNLSNVDLIRMIDRFLETDAVAAFLCVKPNVSFHIVLSEADGQVVDLVNAQDAGIWSNGGFFVFRQAIFDYIKDGEELVEEPFRRLIGEKKLLAYRHGGFWACMDTYKEKQQLDNLVSSGVLPWEVWETNSTEKPQSTPSPWSNGVPARRSSVG